MRVISFINLRERLSAVRHRMCLFIQRKRKHYKMKAVTKVSSVRVFLVFVP